MTRGIHSPRTSGAEEAFAVTHSLDFVPSADFLARTLGTPTDAKKWTLSCWVKCDTFHTNGGVLMWAPTNVHVVGLGGYYWASNNGEMVVVNNPHTCYAASNQTMATGVWVHLLWAIDSTQATASDRIKMYMDGVQTTHRVSGYPTLNQTFAINTALGHRIGNYNTLGAPVDGKVADYHFIDGQALEPTSFIDGTGSGTCSPIRYTGSYGNNGFWLTFFDDADAASIGRDDAGGDPGDAAGANDWTLTSMGPANISTDVPG